MFALLTHSDGGIPEKALTAGEKWIYAINTRKVTKTYGEVKRKYEEGAKGVKERLSVKSMNQFRPQEHKWLEKSFEHITMLESIAHKADSIFTLKHLDFLIQRMVDKRFAAKVRKLKEVKQQMESKKPQRSPEL